jgi:hypothetical protein
MARVKGINVEFGISIATGDKSWVKATAGMEVEFDSPNDTTDDTFEMAWGRVTHEVSKQVSNFGVQVTNNTTGAKV